MSDNDDLQQIAHLRREYTRGGLRRHDLPAEPLTLFERWLRQACDARLADPTAMVVATVDENGQPYQRIVLLKHYDEKGLVFYTNLGSRKAHQLENNPRISLLFPWHMLERQVMGVYSRYLGGKEWYLFGLSMPFADVADRPQARMIIGWHKTLASFGYWLIGLHAAAALFHHYIVKDNALVRMLPLMKKR